MPSSTRAIFSWRLSPQGRGQILPNGWSVLSESSGDPSEGPRRGVPGPQPRTPQFRALRQPRSMANSPTQMPQEADTWLPLQCGERAPETRARALRAGRPLEVFRRAGRGGRNSTLPE